MRIVSLSVRDSKRVIMAKLMRQLSVMTAVGLLTSLVSCASDQRPDPRDTVKGLFTAIQASDSLFLTESVDLASAVATLGEEFSTDTTTPTASQSQSLLAALTGEGQLRKRWLDDQIVLGRSMVSGDPAWVEVSFIDRLTRVQYYNKMRLEFRNSRWVINSFRTL